MSITFANDDVDFVLNDAERLKKWIERVVTTHNKRLGRIAYRFCSDQKIWETNVAFLNHDTYTDIITFDNVSGDVISGDIIISVDRVGDNAANFNVSFEQEFYRVLIHGVLHLLGFKDKCDQDAAQMRLKEEESMDILFSMFPDMVPSRTAVSRGTCDLKSIE